jgi:predicted enzyme related to lactoylglutathione lyase
MAKPLRIILPFAREDLMSAVGIGGFFFRAEDPEALQNWYRTHLGIGADPAAPWMQQAGPTMFVPFPKGSDDFPSTKQWMINFRVTELAPLLAALRAAAIEVTTHPEWDTPQTGKFARIHDPEGNAIELWEPPAE